MRAPSLLILTAVTLEAKAIADALGMDCPKPRKPSKVERDGISITLALTGVSARHLPDEPAARVVMAGLAGALDPSLAVGDLVVDDWPASLPVPAGVRRGSIHTDHRIAATPKEKADLFAQTRALAVDMENSAVREWARKQGAEFGAIRAISDRADQTLDPAVLTLIDFWGRPRPLAIAGTLLRHPRLIPHLMRVGRDSKEAARRLGRSVRESVVSTR
jgi:adenosylhomocysteine nucleosidase